MKIVRPEQQIKREQQKEENVSLIIDGHECKSYTKEEMEFEYNPKSELEELGKETEQKYQDFAAKTIEDVMNSVTANYFSTIDELEENTNTVSFNITLTKRQYELYTQKGGICWLKKALVGQVRTKKKKSSKKR